MVSTKKNITILQKQHPIKPTPQPAPKRTPLQQPINPTYDTDFERLPVKQTPTPQQPIKPTPKEKG